MSMYITKSHSVKSGAQGGCYNFGKSGSVIGKIGSILLYGSFVNYKGISEVLFQKGFVQLVTSLGYLFSLPRL